MRVQELMARARLTLVQWADYAGGLQPSSLRAWAAGLRNPEPESIEALANGLEHYTREVAPEIIAGLRQAAADRRSLKQ